VEFAKRTMLDRVRQEHAKAEQAEILTSRMRSEELLARLALIEKLRSMNLALIRDVQGNIDVVRTTSDVLEALPDRVLKAEEISSAVAKTLKPSDGGD
jgi:hypothetical protein